MVRGMRGRLGMLAVVAIGIMALAWALSADPAGRVGGWLAAPDRRPVPVDLSKAEGAGRRYRERRGHAEERAGFVGPPRTPMEASIQK